LYEADNNNKNCLPFLENGVMRLYRSGATNVTASDGTISTAAPLAVTVSTAPASGSYSNTITAATSEGTTYTSATLTASK
jgi:hypothetical protein